MAKREYNAVVKFQTQGTEDITKLLQNLRVADGITDSSVENINQLLTKLGGVGAELKKQLATGKIDSSSLGFEELEKEVKDFANKTMTQFKRSMSMGGNETITKLHEDFKKAKQEAVSLEKEIKELDNSLDDVNKVDSKSLKKYDINAANEVKKVEEEIAKIREKQAAAKTPKRKSELAKELKQQNAVLEATKKQVIQQVIKEKNEKKTVAIQKRKIAQEKKGYEMDALINKTKDERLKILSKIVKLTEQGNVSVLELENIQKVTEATKKAKDAKENLDKVDSKHNQTLLGKVATGVKYYVVLNQLRRLYRSIIKTVTELDDALTQVAMVTTMNRKEAWALVPAYQNLAREVGMTTTEVANLSIYFFRQGRSAEDAMKMTEVAAKAAKVAAIDATESANYLTSAINGFGLAASEAEAVADKFAALGAASASSYEELAKAMSKVAPAARVAGIDIDHMMGFIAKGIETTREAPENIGTAFKTIFSRMRELKDIGKTMEDGMDVNKVEKALKSVGVQLRDSQGQFRDLQDVINEVGGVWDTLDRNHQAYIATALAGTRQQARLLALFQDYDRTLELVEESQNSAGAMNIQHSEYMDGMAAAVTGLKTAWQTFITTITDSEVVIGVVRGLTTFVDGLAAAMSAFGAPAQVMLGLISSLTIAMILLNTQTMFNLRTSISTNLAKMAEVAITSGLIKTKLAEVAVDKMSNLQKLKAIGLYIKEILFGEQSRIGKIKSAIATKISASTVRQETLEKVRNMGATSILTGGIAGLVVAMFAQVAAFFAGVAANIAFGTSLVFATAGLILLVPLIIGVVAGMIKFIKQAKKGQGPLKSIGKLFGGIFSILKKLVGLFFAIGKAIGWFVAKVLGTLFDGLGKLFKWLGKFKLFQGIGNAFKKLGGWLSSATDRFNKLTMSAADYTEQVKELNKQRFEAEKDAKNMKKLGEEYKRLNDKVEKTPEDLQRMQEIIQELPEDMRDVSASGAITLDIDAFNLEYGAGDELGGQAADEIEQMKNDTRDAFANAVKKASGDEMKDVLADDTNQEVFREWLYSMGEVTDEDDFSEQVESNVNRSLDNMLGNIDLEDKFMKKTGTKGALWWKEDVYEIDEEAMAEFAENAKEAVGAYYTAMEKAQNEYAEDIKREGSSDVNMIQAQLDAYDAALAEAGDDEELIQLVQDQFAGAQAWLDLQGEGLSVDVMWNLNQKGLSANQVQDLMDAIGADKVNQFGSGDMGTKQITQTMQDMRAEAGDTAEEIKEMEKNIKTLYSLMSNGTAADFADNLDDIASNTDKANSLLDKYNKGTITANELLELRNILGEDYNAVMNGTLTIEEAMEAQRISGKQKLIDELALLEETYATDQTNEYYLEEQARLNILIDNWDMLNANVLSHADKLKDISTLMKDIADTTKTLNALTEYGFEGTELFDKLEELRDANQAQLDEDISRQMTEDIAHVDDLFNQLEREGLVENGMVLFDTQMTDEQLKIYNDYIEAMGELQDTTDLYTQNIKAQAKEIQDYYKDLAKEVNESYKMEIDSIKNANKERWKAIEYTDKLLETNNKIADVRRRMAGIALNPGASGEMEKLQEEADKLAKEKQKLIEKEIMEQELALLENEKDQRLEELQQEEIDAMNLLVEAMNNNSRIFSEYMGQDYEAPSVNPTSPNTPPTFYSMPAAYWEQMEVNGQARQGGTQIDTINVTSNSPQEMWDDVRHYTRDSGMVPY